MLFALVRLSRSEDGGRTWRNWTYDELGPEFQYVAPTFGIAHPTGYPLFTLLKALTAIKLADRVSRDHGVPVIDRRASA